MRGFRFLRLDGQTPVAKRQPLVDRFNSKYGGEDQETVFLLSSKAGGVGLNLIGQLKVNQSPKGKMWSAVTLPCSEAFMSQPFK